MISPKVRKILIGVIIVGLAVLGASLIGNNSQREDTNPITSTKIDAPIDSQSGSFSSDEFFTTLLNAKNINIDISIFKNPAFLYLKDHPIVIGTDTSGRSNPFLPIGTDPVINDFSGTSNKTASENSPSQLQNQQTTNIETLQPGKITSTTAEFGAVVNFPFGTGPAVVVFEYGLTQESTVPTESLIIQDPKTITLPVTGLQSNKTYYVRANLLYGSQTLRGSMLSFTTKVK